MIDLDAIMGLADQMHPHSKTKPTLIVEPTDDGKRKVAVKQGFGDQRIYCDATHESANEASRQLHDELVRINEQLAKRCRDAIARFARRTLHLVGKP